MMLARGLGANWLVDETSRSPHEATVTTGSDLR